MIQIVLLGILPIVLIQLHIFIMGLVENKYMIIFMALMFYILVIVACYYYYVFFKTLLSII